MKYIISILLAFVCNTVSAQIDTAVVYADYDLPQVRLSEDAVHVNVRSSKVFEVYLYTADTLADQIIYKGDFATSHQYNRRIYTRKKVSIKVVTDLYSILFLCKWAIED